MVKYGFITSLLVLLTACSLGGGSNTPNATVSSETKFIETPKEGSGKHEVMIFADFQCPACISFAENVGPILEGYAREGKLTIVYKQYPLTQIHKNAFRDALAALCSAEGGKYLEYKKELYALEREKAGAKVSDEERIGRATKVGLDGAAFGTCLASERYKAQVEKDMADGDALRVEGTPTVFLDGKKLDFSVFRGDIGVMTKFFDGVVAN